MKREFEGRKFVVLGSSGGIGFETAKALLDRGGTVLLHGRGKPKLKRRYAELSSKYPDRVLSIQADIEKGRDRMKLVNFCRSKLGGVVDSLIFCVGSGKYPRSAFLSDREWFKGFGQNFFSIVSATRDIVPLIKKKNSSSIIFIGSIAGIEDIGAPAVYAAAKAALSTFSKSLAAELAPLNIRVNIIHPGNVLFVGGRWEEILNSNKAKTNKYIRTHVPLRRFGTPDEIAETIAFLVSSRAKFITGSSLIVDGGQHKSLR